MADLTPKSILENEIPATLQAQPALGTDINAIVHFVVTGDQGGQWTLDLTKPSNWVSSGINGESKMTVTVGDQDFVKIRQGQLNAQMAAMSGKIKFKPMDMGLAMKLAKLLA